MLGSKSEVGKGRCDTGGVGREWQGKTGEGGELLLQSKINE